MRPYLHAAAVAAVLAMGPAPAPAAAQHGSMSMGLYNEEGSFRPDLSLRDLKVIARVLALSPDEERALSDLYSGYAAALQGEGAEVREFVSAEIERAEIMENTGELEKARTRVREWTRRSEQIKTTFLEDLRSLLSREQEGRWPIVERELRRLKLIGTGRLSGESVDLVRLTEDVLGAPPTAELGELLNRYSEELDRALVAREALLKEEGKEFSEKLRGEPLRAKAVWDRAQEARGRVRDLNERYARQIASQLSPGQKAAFEQKLFDQSYPVLVRSTRAEQYLKDACELDSLAGDQAARLSATRAKYEADRRAFLNRTAAAWRHYEADAKPDWLAIALGERIEGEKHIQQYNGAWLPESHPLSQSRRERLALDVAMRKAVDAVLTPEQRTSVPSRTTPHARFENWEPYGL
ncbi:MAG: hypothetical protein WD749_04650 [Phycisphaerales bacterium]